MTSPELQGFTGLAADSVDPALIPATFKAAFPYLNGRYEWPTASAVRFEWIAHISVTGDPAAAAAARIQDIERFDATPDRFPPFAENRLSLKHSCGIAYESLSVVAEVVQALDEASMSSDPWQLFVAWWWGKPVAPTRAQVVQALQNPVEIAADLIRRGHQLTQDDALSLAKGLTVTVAPERIAACQFLPGGPFDTTVVYEPHMLHRPHGWPS